MSELLPCPFCGNEAEFKPYKRDGLTLKCKSFGCVQFNQRTLRFSLDWLQGKMTEHWNSRHTPEGWKMAPIEPTPEMMEADWNVTLSDAHTDGGVGRCAWAAMLNAAPAPGSLKGK
jgi:hypothetical protein